MDIRRRDLNSIRGLFVVYLVLLVWVVLWKLEPPYIGGGGLRPVNWAPYLWSQPREVVANVALFIPFGIYLRLLRPSWPWWVLAAVAGGASVVLEVAQWLLMVGIPDVSDVISNTIGGLVGVGLFALLRSVLRQRTVPVMVWVCGLGTALALVAVGTFLASPVRYRTPDDTGPLSASSQWHT